MSETVNAPFDEALVVERRKRAYQTRHNDHFLMARAVEDASDRLGSVLREFKAPVTLFCSGTTTLDLLQRLYPTSTITQLEADGLFAQERNEIGAPSRFGLNPSQFDLAVSLLAMHAVNDLTGFLIQSRLCLQPDGLFLGCLLGSGTLQELRQVLLEAEIETYGGASPRIAPFADIKDMGALLQRAGFALPVADIDTLNVRYADIFALVKDLRQMGLANALNARSRKPLSRAFWSRASEIYSEKFSDPDGRIRATFSVIWLSGWAPAPNQPKALAPGSATISLKDVL